MTAARLARASTSVRDTVGRDADQDRPGVAGIHHAGHQSGVLEATHLGGHRRLGAVVQGGEVGDARLAAILDGGQQPRLRPRHRELCALVGQTVEPRDRAEQIAAQIGGAGRGAGRHHASNLHSFTM